jgi:mRNA-degrading endonuclease RelE of RelBE toxin-antitoxin system
LRHVKAFASILEIDSKVKSGYRQVMPVVTITAEAQRQFEQLPLPIQRRVRDVMARLADWPSVSGAKPLRKELAGSFRIRTGDYRVVFRVTGDRVLIWRVDNPRDVYS